MIQQRALITFLCIHGTYEGLSLLFLATFCSWDSFNRKRGCICESARVGTALVLHSSEWGRDWEGKTENVTNSAGEFRLTREVKSSERERRGEEKKKRQSRKTLKGRIKAVSEDEDEDHVLHIFQQHWSQILLLCVLHQALRPYSPVSVCLCWFCASAVDLDCNNTAAQDICSEREREEGELKRKNSMSLFTFFLPEWCNALCWYSHLYVSESCSFHLCLQSRWGWCRRLSWTPGLATSVALSLGYFGSIPTRSLWRRGGRLALPCQPDVVGLGWVLCCLHLPRVLTTLSGKIKCLWVCAYTLH